MPRLLFREMPGIGEPLLTFLERVGRANFYRDIAWLIDGSEIAKGAKITRRTLREIAFGQVPLNKLEVLCDVPPGSMSALVHPLVEGDGTQCRFGDHVLPVDQLGPLRRRRCPECEARGIPQSRLIELPLYTACHQHGCWLVGDCPKCGAILRHSHRFDRCSNCKHPDELRVEQADPLATEVAMEIARLESGQSAAVGAPYSSLAQLLSGLANAALIDDPKSIFGRSDQVLHMYSDAQLRDRVCGAWSWIRNQDSYLNTRAQFLGERMTALPHSAKPAWGFRIDFTLQTRTDCAVVAAMRQWEEGAPRVSPRPCSADRVSSIRTEVHTSRTVCLALGVPRSAATAIVRGNLLAPERRQLKSFKCENTFQAGEIDNLYARIRSVPPDSTPWVEGEALSLESASGRAIFNGVIGIAGVLKAILDCRIRYRFAPEAPLSAIEVNVADLHLPVDALPEGFVAHHEAAKVLGLTYAELRAYLQCGFLNGQRVKRNGQWGYLVAYAEIDRFKREHVVARDLAKQHGAHATVIAQRLIFAGATPVCDRNRHRAAPIAFNRAEVSDTFVIAALANPDFRRFGKFGGPHSQKSVMAKLLTNDQAAERLGLSRTMIGKLVSSGHLKRYDGPEVRARFILFCPEEISRYELMYWRNPALIEVGKAMRMLGTTRIEFSRQYLQTERLKLAEDGAGREYVNRASVSHLKKSAKDDCITSSEATREFGITTLASLRLQPIRTIEGTHGRRLLYSRKQIRERLRQLSKVIRLTG